MSLTDTIKSAAGSATKLFAYPKTVAVLRAVVGLVMLVQAYQALRQSSGDTSEE